MCPHDACMPSRGRLGNCEGRFASSHASAGISKRQSRPQTDAASSIWECRWFEGRQIQCPRTSGARGTVVVAASVGVLSRSATWLNSWTSWQSRRAMPTSHFCRGKWRQGPVAACPHHQKLSKTQPTVHRGVGEPGGRRGAGSQGTGGGGGKGDSGSSGPKPSPASGSSSKES